MSRYELRFAARHPVRWLRYWWLHGALAALLATMAITWTEDIFAQVLQPNLWPIAMGAVSFGVLLSAIAPHVWRLQAVVAASMITMGILRAAAMAEVWWAGEASRPVVLSLGVHALILSALGIVWQDWTAACAQRATIEVGQDDRETPRA